MAEKHVEPSPASEHDDVSDNEISPDRVPLNIDGKIKSVPRIVQEELEVDVPVKLQRMGIDHEIHSDDEDIHIQCGRVKTIEGLEKCKNIKSIRLIANLVDKLDNLEPAVDCEHLEVYQACLTKIENISHMNKLIVLDLSFNEIRKIENLDSLVNLEKLYLSANKISKIEGLDNLKKLRMLELGSNRIRNLEGLPELPNLEELWLGKNKLSSMSLPNRYPKLEYVSMQSNRLEEWDLETLRSHKETLVHFQVSHNRLPDLPEDFDFILSNLNVLDLAKNIISKIPNLKLTPALEDLWMNDNEVANPDELDKLKDAPKSLGVLYLERNPVQIRMGPGYKQVIIEHMPQLKQLDALPLHLKVNVNQTRRNEAEVLMKALLAKQLAQSAEGKQTNVTEEEKKYAEDTKAKTTSLAKGMGMQLPPEMEFMALDADTIAKLRSLAAPAKPSLKRK